MKKFIEALAEVLNVDVNQYDDMTEHELLATLEDIQAQEVMNV